MTIPTPARGLEQMAYKVSLIIWHLNIYLDTRAFCVCLKQFCPRNARARACVKINPREEWRRMDISLFLCRRCLSLSHTPSPRGEGTCGEPKERLLRRLTFHAHVYFAGPTIAIPKIRDYSQSRGRRGGGGNENRR